MIKRLFDFSISVIATVVFLPLMACVALVVVFDSGLPVFFLQSRIGRNGKEFQIFKFRTMTVAIGSEKGSFDVGSNKRVTRVGKILRKTKMDELPQLWNVMVGDMSLVGPRPEVKKWVEAYPVRWSAIHSVRPGITDPASIEFRDEEEMLAGARNPEEMYKYKILPKKLSCYESYINSRSFFGDIFILIKTIRALF